MQRKFLLLLVVIISGSLFLTLILVRQRQDPRSSAAAPDQLEAEEGILSSTGVNKQNDSGASGAQFVLFANQTLTPTPTTPQQTGTFPPIRQLPVGPAPDLPSRPSYLGTVVDSRFGGTIKRITNTPGWHTGYPPIPAWSATGKYLSLNGDQRRLFDGKTYAYIGNYFAMPADGATIWSNIDDDLMYGASDNSNVLRTYKPSTNTTGIRRTFTGYTYVRISSSGNLANDDRTILLKGLKNGVWRFILYNPRDDIVIAEKDIRHPITGSNSEPKALSVSKRGTWIIFGYGVGVPTNEWGFWYMDRNLNVIGSSNGATWHADHCIDSFGNETYVTQDGYMRYYATSKPPIYLFPYETNSNLIAMGHLSCRGPDGWAYPSSNFMTRDPSTVRGYDMIYRVKLDGSGDTQVWNFAHAMASVQNAYVGDVTDPYAIPSRDGSRVVFSSKWASPTTPYSEIHSYVVEYK